MSSENRVVLITGASSGIGKEAAFLLSKMGMTVILLSRNEMRLKEIVTTIKNEGGQAAYYVIDVSSHTSFDQIVSLIIERYGHLDVLVNNAGIMLLSEVHERKVDEWNQMINVNLKGVLNGTAAVLPVMREQQSGHIVNVISTAAYRTMKGSAVYSATKAAIKSFSEGLRKEEANQGIRVNLIAPGPTKTNLLSKTSSDDLKNDLSEYVATYGIDPKDVAQAIAFQIMMPKSASVDDLIISTAYKKE